jgi:hypothetical protein
MWYERNGQMGKGLVMITFDAMVLHSRLQLEPGGVVDFSCPLSDSGRVKEAWDSMSISVMLFEVQIDRGSKKFKAALNHAEVVQFNMQCSPLYAGGG